MEKPVDIAILARAPVPGVAKTRLIPAIGPHAASRLHRQMVLHTLRTACEAKLGGAVVLWGAPDRSHRFFRSLARQGVTCQDQAAGDLGERMRHALDASHPRPALLIGTDCPCLTPAHLQDAAQALMDGHDAVLLPAEDGGYVLIGLRSAAHRQLFNGISWGSSTVMDQTRHRLRILGYSWAEPATLWDVDNPEDLIRLGTLGDFKEVSPLFNPKWFAARSPTG